MNAKICGFAAKIARFLYNRHCPRASIYKSPYFPALFISRADPDGKAPVLEHFKFETLSRMEHLKGKKKEGVNLQMIFLPDLIGRQWFSRHGSFFG